MKIISFTLIAIALLIGFASCLHPHMAHHRPPMPPHPGIGNIYYPSKPYYNNRRDYRYQKRYQRNRYYDNYYDR